MLDESLGSRVRSISESLNRFLSRNVRSLVASLVKNSTDGATTHTGHTLQFRLGIVTGLLELSDVTGKNHSFHYPKLTKSKFINLRVDLCTILIPSFRNLLNVNRSARRADKFVSVIELLQG